MNARSRSDWRGLCRVWCVRLQCWLLVLGRSCPSARAGRVRVRNWALLHVRSADIQYDCCRSWRTFPMSTGNVWSRQKLDEVGCEIHFLSRVWLLHATCACDPRYSARDRRRELRRARCRRGFAVHAIGAARRTAREQVNCALCQMRHVAHTTGERTGWHCANGQQMSRRYRW